MRPILLVLIGITLGQAPFNPERPPKEQRGASAVWSKSVSRIDIGVTQSVAITGGFVTMVLPKGAPGGSQTATPRPAYITGKRPSAYVNAAHQTGVGPGVYVTEAGWAELHRVWADREQEIAAMRIRADDLEGRLAEAMARCPR